MNTRQKQVMDSLVRVRSFLEAHPATGALNYAGAQVSGRELGRGEVRRRADQIALPFDRRECVRAIRSKTKSQIAARDTFSPGPRQ